MHYEVHDSSGTPLLLLHGGLFDIHQQFDELLPGRLTERPIDPANHPGGCPQREFGIVSGHGLGGACAVNHIQQPCARMFSGKPVTLGGSVPFRTIGQFAVHRLRS
jgi:hypothetical protein